MNVGYCASVSTIQKARKWPNIDTKYCARVASRKKNAKLYIAKGSLNAKTTNGSSQWSTAGVPNPWSGPGLWPCLDRAVGTNLLPSHTRRCMRGPSQGWMLNQSVEAKRLGTTNLHRILSSTHYHSPLLKNSPDHCFVFG